MMVQSNVSKYVLNRSNERDVLFFFCHSQESMRAASSLGDRPVQAKCLVCVGDIQRSQNNNEVSWKSAMEENKST